MLLATNGGEESFFSIQEKGKAYEDITLWKLLIVYVDKLVNGKKKDKRNINQK